MYLTQVEHILTAVERHALLHVNLRPAAKHIGLARAEVQNALHALPPKGGVSASPAPERHTPVGLPPNVRAIDPASRQGRQYRPGA